MDQIFDRLGNLLKSVFQDDDTGFSKPENLSDPDMQAAWDELNDFLNADSGSSSQARTERPRSSFRESSIPAAVREAYATIGVPSTATNEEIAKAYKALLLKHHPDRFANDPAKLASATEKTKLINRAFQELKTYRMGKKA